MGSTTVDYPNEFKGFAITDPKDWATPKLTSYEPKKFGPRDVDVEIECCGVCASELFTLKNTWSDQPLACCSSAYGPKSQCVGHEIIGKVVKVGEQCTTGVKVGDRVGVGAQASACGECSNCLEENIQYCPKMVGTYASRYPDGYVSQGGYASHVRAHELLTFPIPEPLESHIVAPMMCGGLTVYSPIKRNIEDVLAKGKETPKVGVIGIGGLGHMAIMIAKALGAHVTAFSRSNAKKEDAIKMGADAFVATGEKGWNKGLERSFHLVLNCATSTESLPLTQFIGILGVNRSFISVGLPHKGEQLGLNTFALLRNGAKYGASLLGSREEAVELLELAAKNGIKPWVEKIKISEAGVHEALTRLDGGDVKYRFTLVGFHDFFGTGNTAGKL